MTDKERYDYRKQNHLCVVCGDKIPDGDNRVLCEFCRTKDKLAYKARRKGEICPHCGKVDAYTMNGWARCADCTEKQNERIRRYRKIQRQDPDYSRKCAEQRKQQYYQRRKERKCVQCAKDLPSYDNHVRCAFCRMHDKMNCEPSKMSRDNAQYCNLCYMCLRKEPLKGRRMCEECYEKLVKNSIKARAAVKNESHIWRAREALRLQEVRKRYGWEEKPTNQE